MITQSVLKMGAFLLASAFSEHPTGDFYSPILSTVPEIQTRNTHVVIHDSDDTGKILRGMGPNFQEDIDQLKQYGITDVIIFKTDTDELDAEKDRLTTAKIRTMHAKFPWKDFEDHGGFDSACKMTVKALHRMNQVMKSSKRKLFFHCTVGEDRTGMLAGLARLLFEKNLNPKNLTDHRMIFDEELCNRGYEHGNPYKKFSAVVCPIRSELTSFYAKMTYKIYKGYLQREHLDLPLEKAQNKICKVDPADDELFNSLDAFDAANLRCSEELVSKLEMDPMPSAKRYKDNGNQCEN